MNLGCVPYIVFQEIIYNRKELSGKISNQTVENLDKNSRILWRFEKNRIEFNVELIINHGSEGFLKKFEVGCFIHQYSVELKYPGDDKDKSR